MGLRKAEIVSGCRDLTWSRHQLEELAERRFLAAQDSAKLPQKNVPTMDELGVQLDSLSPIARTSFQDLFKKVAHADFSSYLAKLQACLLSLLRNCCPLL